MCACVCVMTHVWHSKDKMWKQSKGRHCASTVTRESFETCHARSPGVVKALLPASWWLATVWLGYDHMSPIHQDSGYSSMSISSTFLCSVPRPICFCLGTASFSPPTTRMQGQPTHQWETHFGNLIQDVTGWLLGQVCSCTPQPLDNCSDDWLHTTVHTFHSLFSGLFRTTP